MTTPPGTTSTAPATPLAPPDPDEVPAVAAFRPAAQADLAPSGDVSRIRANIAALRVLRTLQAERRQATENEQRILARWSGWGAVPGVFDPDRDDHATHVWAREQLAELLDEDEWRAARRTTLNAHYTDASVVQAMWDAVQQLGFTGGDVLEPGSGSGNFIGFAPDGARMVGIELDPTTAAISAALYPRARILNESFADTRTRAGTFDLVVGNVPFSQIAPHDRRYNAAGHSIHDYFIVKGLHLLRPGGLMAVLTSHYSMDRGNPAARREIASLADLVGAVRLPSGAMAKAAGTDAVIDVLVLRRREDGRPAEPSQDWETTRRITLGEDEVRVNGYFLDHPERVLGRLGTGGLHRASELVINGDRDCAPSLVAALRDIIVEADARGLRYSNLPVEIERQPVAFVVAAQQQAEGYLTALFDGRFTKVIDGERRPYAPPKTQALELRELLRLRDTAIRLLEAEAAARDDTDEIDNLRAELGRHYDSYLERYGPINRYNSHPTGKVDEETGEPIMRRVAPAQGGFRTDPFASLVYALERFDEAAQVARKADLFTARTIAPRAPKLGAETPEDAIAICHDVYGELTLDRVAWLLGVDEIEARERLGTLVYDEPGTDRLVPAAEYLSGDVRAKLDRARAAAEEDERYGPNVEALAAAKPVDLTPEEIRVRLGASWVSGAVIQQFLQDLLDDPTLQVEHHDGGSDWDVISRRRDTTLATSTWGTARMSAVDIAKALLQQRPVRVYDVDPVTEKRVVNPDASLAAQTKATEINERFAEWLWGEPQRAAEHLTIYNERFNSLVLRSYDDVTLTLPGLALTFKPHAHQHAAVARMVNEPSVGLFHEVGAGKTAEMVMGVMELRRLGMARKPLVIVPNHMLEQFTREFLQLYPQANLLSASSADLAAERRRLFQARVTTGNWDAVIMTHRAFEQVAMSPQYQKTYLQAKIKKLEARLGAAIAADKKRLVKQLEGAIGRAEERIKKKLDTKKDPGLTFEKMGVDYLCVDEGHLFKNLERTSKIPGMGIVGSNRATDLDMKLRWLRETNDRVVTIATATPIANSIGEVHTMLMYLAPELMAQLRVHEFDPWAATFGETVEGIEVVPEGGGLRMNSRFAKFYNVPELLRIMHQVADVKTAEDLKLPVPLLRERDDGQRAPRTVVVPPSDGLGEYLAALVDRADRVRKGQVEPAEDNLLKITHNGRSAAMDLRLVPPTAEEVADILRRYEVLDDDTTIAALAGMVAEQWVRRRPNPLDPKTVAWPTELWAEEGTMLWPGRFDRDIEQALLRLADANDWSNGQPSSNQILDTLTNHDGLGNASVRELVAAHLIDQWAVEPPDPQNWRSFRWPHRVVDSAGQPVWTGELPRSLRQTLIAAYRSANDDRPLTAAQLAELMDGYDWLAEPVIRERLATDLARLWSEQPPAVEQYGDHDARADHTAWPEAVCAPPALLWSGRFTEEAQAAMLAVRGIEVDTPSKLTIAAESIARIHAEHRDDVFADENGEPHERRGALQIVFSDLGVPADGWNAYDELRDQLVARGVPRAQVRFVHEARNDSEKAQLFAAARDGRISVLVGSTEKMGVGTNVQTRAVALHHLDCPWRPADLQQREGRILRQGNQNAEVDIYRYVTEGSFDGFMWQTVARKAQFIAQMMRGRLDVREIEDIGDAALSYNEVKALATGNPLLLDQAALQAEVTKLERLERSHHWERDRMRWVRRQQEQDLTILRAEINEVQAAQARRVDTTGDKFRITVLNRETTERKQGNAMLRDALVALTMPPPRGEQEIATIGGFSVVAEHRWIEAQDRRLLYVGMPDIPRARFALSPKELEEADVVGRLENRLRALDAILGQLQRDLTGKEQELDRVISGLDASFKHAAALDGARTRLEEVNAKITKASSVEPPPPTGTEPREAVPAKRRIEPGILRAGRPGHPDGNNTADVLTLTIAAIEIYGWASRRDADASNGNLVPTAAIVDTALNGDGYDATALREELEELVTDETRAYAAAVREHAIGQAEHDFSEYAYQLRLAATQDTVSPRRFSTLVSAVNSYQRHEQDRAVREATTASTWQGKAGDKVSFDAKVLTSRSFNRERRGGQTSATTVYLADVSGNLFTWRAPNLNAYRDGTFVRVAGRIKGHDTADGHKHTELTRCALAPITTPPGWAVTRPDSDEPAPETDSPGKTSSVEPLPAPDNEPERDAEPDVDVSVSETTTIERNLDSAQREEQIRRREIIMAIEEHAAGYQRSTGVAYRYIAEMVDATPSEWEWIKNYIAEHPDVLALPYRTPAQWDDIRHKRGEEAFRRSEAAHAAGDVAGALDGLDEARAYGVLSATEWQNGREYIYSQVRAESPPDNTGPTTGDEREPDVGRTEQRDPPESDPLAPRRAQVRQRQLLLAIEQYSPGYYRVADDGVRYAAKIVNATEEERDWMAAHVRDNPQLLDGERLGDERIHEINQEAARTAFAAATEAIQSGDYARALDRLDDAEVRWPHGHPDRGGSWDRYRAVVVNRAGASSTSLTLPDPGDCSDSPPAASGSVHAAPTLAQVSTPTSAYVSATADRPPADTILTGGGTRVARGR